jgi:two-component system, LytTR family, sensor kinase
MLLENAIKHNVISREYPLSITISAKSTNYLEVSNKLKKKPAISSSNLGLNNIKSRYEYFTKNPVIVTENENEFRVEIPLIVK